MSKHPECDPNAFAFPIPLEGAFGGLTKREYFAATVMDGMASDPNCINPVMVAKIAVEWADALIAALNAEPEPVEEKP